jgi:hypothetical protein
MITAPIVVRYPSRANKPVHGRAGAITVESLAAEFPAWEAWQGIDRLWHVRIRGAVPPVMVHGEDLVDLRDQIRAYVGRQEEFWKGAGK